VSHILEATYLPPNELLGLGLAELVALRDATAVLPSIVRERSGGPPER
jgi:hypothetical protein